MPDTSQNQKPSVIQEILGNRITKFVMWGTVIIGIIGVVFAFLALNADESKVKSSFSILQYVFGVLLPLWGTWIGTILAYYYSKENFESANKSVQQLVDKLTSDKKLETVMAKDVMIPKDKLIFQTIENGDLSKFKLTDCLDFTQKNSIRRLLLLDGNGSAIYAIHRDLISLFIAAKAVKKESIDDCTLSDMKNSDDKEINDTFQNSVKFISVNSNLLEAKKIMDQYKNCQDVFVTQTGKAEEPVLGWITNVTIASNSII